MAADGYLSRACHHHALDVADGPRSDSELTADKRQRIQWRLLSTRVAGQAAMTQSRPVVVRPGGAVGQPRMHPVPGGGHGGAVPGSHRAGGDPRVRAGCRVGQRQLAAVLARQAVVPAGAVAAPGHHDAPVPGRQRTRPARSLTGPSARGAVSASSNSSSARAVRQAWGNRCRNRDGAGERLDVRASRRESCAPQAFVSNRGPLARTHDSSAKAVLTNSDTPDDTGETLIRNLRG